MLCRSIFGLIISLGVLNAATAQNAEIIQESGDWTAYTYDDATAQELVCFISSNPTESEGDYRDRGPVWLQVTHRKPNQATTGSAPVVSFAAGFDFWEDSQPLLTVGDERYRLVSQGGHAWSFPKDDEALTRALRQGSTLTIETKSSRGTEIRDTFSLRGVTALHNRISDVCGVASL